MTKVHKQEGSRKASYRRGVTPIKI